MKRAPRALNFEIKITIKIKIRVTRLELRPKDRSCFCPGGYSRALESMRIVTGPSLVRLTSICAPNSPVATGLPKS